ncbi:hypothetical protein A7982_13230 [Minicystis rosea]|nr:hypothetical protein A7982_13230 [Minicystis rosea]
MAILLAWAPLLRGLWAVSLGSAVVFYALCYAAPGLVVRLQSMPWTFHVGRNLDLDFQTVTYATYHTRRFNQITHWPLILDQVAWFVVLERCHPALSVAAVALLLAQAARLGERRVGFAAVVVWPLIALGASLFRDALGDEAAYLLAIVVLMAGTILRCIGHCVEPLPPMMAEESDQFLPVRRALDVRRFWLFPLFGYCSELCAGMPFRLFVVQIAWATARLTGPLQRVIGWSEAARHAREIHARGFRVYPPAAHLLAPHIAADTGARWASDSTTSTK